MRTGPRNLHLHLTPGIPSVEAFGESKEVVFYHHPSRKVNYQEEVLLDCSSQLREITASWDEVMEARIVSMINPGLWSCMGTSSLVSPPQGERSNGVNVSGRGVGEKPQCQQGDSAQPSGGQDLRLGAPTILKDSRVAREL